MKNNIFKIGILFTSAVVGFTACNKDLNRMPANTEFTSSVYGTAAGYKQELAAAYSAYQLTSAGGASGASTIAGVDGGTSDFLRSLFNTQELPTDEAICAWNDPGVPDFHNMNWTSANKILVGLYARSIYQITLCNSFIQQCNASAYTSNGISANDTATLNQYKAEARFLRAYQYSVLMDAFGNPPFVTDSSAIGPLSFPKQISRSDLFKYIESELLSCSQEMVAARQNDYGRADQGAAWALLARIYLNAQVYTGTARYTDAITYATKVISAGYSLMPHYANLFKADNNVNNSEFILAIPYDGLNTQTFGGTTFLINSACNNSTYAAGSAGYTMKSADYGVPSGGWAGNRSTANLPNLFPSPDTTVDKRGIFLNTLGVTSTITNVSQFIQGVPVVKFTNMTSAGAQAEPTAGGTLCSTDFPLFRLAEQYLIYAEAVLRGGSGGDMATALGYINLLRQRAYGNTNGNLVTITLQDIINERGRELYWECFRRTDLIRFNQFTSGSYLWPWKGGVASGTGVDAHYNLYPLPSTDLQVNTNLKQNPGY
ncbi:MULTISPECIES: RagB/SusD family nutrient uptake outer membrane protein [Chitinophagaceae]